MPDGQCFTDQLPRRVDQDLVFGGRKGPLREVTRSRSAVADRGVCPGSYAPDRRDVRPINSMRNTSDHKRRLAVIMHRMSFNRRCQYPLRDNRPLPGSWSFPWSSATT